MPFIDEETFEQLKAEGHIQDGAQPRPSEVRALLEDYYPDAIADVDDDFDQDDEDDDDDEATANPVKAETPTPEATIDTTTGDLLKQAVEMEAAGDHETASRLKAAYLYGKTEHLSKPSKPAKAERPAPIDEQITQAERAGDYRLAMALKAHKLQGGS